MGLPKCSIYLYLRNKEIKKRTEILLTQSFNIGKASAPNRWWMRTAFLFYVLEELFPIKAIELNRIENYKHYYCPYPIARPCSNSEPSNWRQVWNSPVKQLSGLLATRRTWCRPEISQHSSTVELEALHCTEPWQAALPQEGSKQQPPTQIDGSSRGEVRLVGGGWSLHTFKLSNYFKWTRRYMVA